LSFSSLFSFAFSFFSSSSFNGSTAQCAPPPHPPLTHLFQSALLFDLSFQFVMYLCWTQFHHLLFWASSQSTSLRIIVK
jgi:hypothetical protein